MQTDQVRVTLVQLFVDGGIFMWPILALSILAVALVIERSVSIALFHLKTEKFIRYLRGGGSDGEPAFDGLGERLFALDASKADLLIEETLQSAFERMGRALPLLGGIGNTAPILGFLGTVSGMIASFRSIAQADRVSVRLVAGGISEALITTGFGLIVAVICIVTEHLVRYYLVARGHSLERETGLFVSSIGAEKAAIPEAGPQ